jgi:excisionase family DNA binding protein
MKIELTLPDDIVKALSKEICLELGAFQAGSKQKPEDTIFDVEGLAKYLLVSNQWVYDRVIAKGIPYFKVGRYNRFKKSAIDKWIDGQSVPSISGSRPFQVVGRQG